MSANLQSLIYETNARYLGLDLSSQMEAAAGAIAAEILKRYGKTKSIAFICGLESNGVLGMAVARHLLLKGHSSNLSVYLVGRVNKLTQEGLKQWQLLQNIREKFRSKNLHLVSDVYSDQVENHEVIVECLAPLNNQDLKKLAKRDRDIVSRCSHFRQKMVCLDVPVPGYSWDLALSTSYPKVADAIVIDVDLPETARQFAGPGDVQALAKLHSSSHKSQNAKVLIIGGDSSTLEQAATASQQFAGTVYAFSSQKRDYKIKPLKSVLGEIINVDDSDLEVILNKAQATLIGPGWESNLPNKALLDYILRNYATRPLILTEEALPMLNTDLLKGAEQIILLINRNQLGALFNKTQSVTQLEGRLRRFCLDHSCHLIVNASTSLIIGRSSFDHSLDLRMSASRSSSTELATLAGTLTSIAAVNPISIAASAATFLTGFANQNTGGNLSQAWTQLREF